MAGVQDPLTDLPPPSRFDFEELSNFAFCAPPSAPPTITWTLSAPPSTQENRLSTDLLLLSTFSAGCHVLHHTSDKVLIGTMFPSETSLQKKKNDLPSLSDQACYLYSCNEQASIIFVLLQYSVPGEQAYAWAKALFNVVDAQEVLILSSIPTEHFRGKLSADDQILFRLETDVLRLTLPNKDECGVPYYPSGSLVEGVAAAIMSWCQMRHKKARLLLLWTDSGNMVISNLVSVLGRLLHGFPHARALNFGQALKVPFKAKSPSNLDIYF